MLSNRWIKTVVIIFIAIFAIGFVVSFTYEQIARSTLEKIGTAALGTEVSIGSLDISPFSGHASVANLRIANPEGFSDKNILTVPYIHTALNLKSIFSDKVIIEIIRIDGLTVSYELNKSGKANLNALKKNINTGGSKEANDSSAKGEDTASKQVVIRSLQIKDIGLEASLGDQDLGRLSVKTIEMSNIGENKKMSARDVVQQVLTVLTQTSIQAASNLSLKSGVNKILDGAGDIGQGLKNIFK